MWIPCASCAPCSLIPGPRRALCVQLATHESLEVLEDRSEALRDQASTFHRQARTAQKRMRSMNARMRRILCVVILLVIVVVGMSFIVQHWVSIRYFFDSMFPPDKGSLWRNATNTTDPEMALEDLADSISEFAWPWD